MSEKMVVQKMQLKERNTIAFVHAPPGYPAALGALPNGMTVLDEPSVAANVTLVFVNTKSELDGLASKMIPFLTPQAVLWVAFRKGTAKPRPDFNRDEVLACAKAAGLQSLTLISLDADWSAFKFKGA